MEKRHINRKRHLAAAVAAMALTGLSYNANAALTLELTADGSTPGSGKAINVTGNTPITLDVWATVTGADGSHLNDGLQSVDLSFTGSGTLTGGLTSTGPSSPWNANGSQAGTPSGSFLGSTDTTNAAGWWIARAGNVQANATGTFELGTITFTPTNASGGSALTSSVQLSLRNVTDGALWFEDATTSAGTGTSPPVVWSNDKEPPTGTSLGTAVSLNFAGSGGPITSEWIHTSDSNWNAGANWSAGIPTAAGDTANFLATGDASGTRTVTLDANETVGTVNFSPAGAGYVISGANTLTFNTASGDATINSTAGNNTISAAVTLAKTTDISVTGTSLTLSSLNTTTFGVNKTGAGTLNVDKLRTGAVSITGGKVTIIANDGTSTGRAAHGSTVASLAISGVGSKLDMTNNTMVVKNTPIGAVRSLIFSGYAGGAWTGDGIVTTGTPPAGKTIGLGYAQGNDANLAVTSPIAGQAYTAADSIIKFTYRGDANMDGSVDGVDIGIWAGNFTGAGGSTTKLWTQGDWNYDGSVDGVDVGLWAANFTGAGGGVLSEPVGGNLAGVSAVPEPASLGLLALAALPLIRRRRRN